MLLQPLVCLLDPFILLKLFWPDRMLFPVTLVVHLHPLCHDHLKEIFFIHWYASFSRQHKGTGIK